MGRSMRPLVAALRFAAQPRLRTPKNQLAEGFKVGGAATSALRRHWHSQELGSNDVLQENKLSGDPNESGQMVHIAQISCPGTQRRSAAPSRSTSAGGSAQTKAPAPPVATVRRAAEHSPHAAC